MIYLLLSILSSTVIALLFKMVDRGGHRLFPVIVINYLTATALGFVTLQVPWTWSDVASQPWVLTAMTVGLLLIAGFFVTGVSIQRVGISATIVTSKMSVIVPIVVSIVFFSESIGIKKVTGLTLALAGIVLTVYTPPQGDKTKGRVWLPLLLFATLGMIDSLVKVGQTQVSEELIPLFTAFSFGMSALIGLGIGLVRRDLVRGLSLREIGYGVAIGLANWGSMYFMMQALNHSGMDSSVVFGVNNIGVISLSVLLALIFFHEKLSKINWLGIVIAMLAAWILSGV